MVEENLDKEKLTQVISCTSLTHMIVFEFYCRTVVLKLKSCVYFCSYISVSNSSNYLLIKVIDKLLFIKFRYSGNYSWNFIFIGKILECGSKI